jgi:hypothetical protein
VNGSDGCVGSRDLDVPIQLLKAALRMMERRQCVEAIAVVDLSLCSMRDALTRITENNA